MARLEEIAKCIPGTEFDEFSSSISLFIDPTDSFFEVDGAINSYAINVGAIGGVDADSAQAGVGVAEYEKFKKAQWIDQIRECGKISVSDEFLWKRLGKVIGDSLEFSETLEKFAVKRIGDSLGFTDQRALVVRKAPAQDELAFSDTFEAQFFIGNTFAINASGINETAVNEGEAG